jgi:glycosyltransferase 2 family protein
VSAVRGRSARAALVVVVLGVTAAFTYLAVRNAHLAEVWTVLRTSDYAWLGPSLALLAVAFVVRAARWQYLFAPGTRPPFRPVAGALLVGYLFNNLLPARAGEVARIASLRRRTGVSAVETSATVVVERAFDVLSLLVLLFVALPWLPAVSWLRTAAVLALVLGVVLATAIAALAVWRETAPRHAVRLLVRLPLVGEKHAEHAARSLLRGLAGLRDLRVGAVAFAITTASWLVVAASFWLAMLTFDLGVSPAAGLLVVIAIGLAMILPSPPAAVGVFEGATVVALAAYGVPESRALSYALVLHALNVVPVIVAGGVALGAHRRLAVASETVPAQTTLERAP